MMRTKIETLLYTLLFACAILALYSFGYAGKVYIALMGAASHFPTGQFSTAPLQPASPDG